METLAFGYQFSGDQDLGVGVGQWRSNEGCRRCSSSVFLLGFENLFTVHAGIGDRFSMVVFFIWPLAAQHLWDLCRPGDRETPGAAAFRPWSIPCRKSEPRALAIRMSHLGSEEDHRQAAVSV